METRILVVDDEENMLVLLKRVLGKEGYQVECAESGEAGLRLLEANAFSLAIVDLSMPGMNGLRFLAQVREMQESIPAILITAFPTWETEQAARRLQCAGYLPKPLDLKRLKVLIQDTLRKAEPRRM
jgi:DNA-binding NtrC family response regulator